MSWRGRVLSFAFPRKGPVRQAEGGSPAETFARVYQGNHWGRRLGKKFYSGPGSHDPRIIGPYVDSVGAYLREFPQPQDVVDLGCGDFQVGSNLRRYCGRYTACDVVPDLIKYNAAKFSHLRVDFRCVDMVADPLPPGQVAFIRQVLQHLANAQIAQILPKLAQYSVVVVTEHLPARTPFVANLDHEFGSGIRVKRDSGVVLTRPPFAFPVMDERELCCVDSGDGRIKTVAYRIR
jgi:SAM-dependent methyltransferase